MLCTDSASSNSIFHLDHDNLSSNDNDNNNGKQLDWPNLLAMRELRELFRLPILIILQGLAKPVNV